MLYALAHPAALLVLLASFVLGVTLHGWVCSAVAAAVARGNGLVAMGRTGRAKATPPHPRHHVDPFGAVAAAIAGMGWAKPLPLPQGGRSSSRWAVTAVALSGAAANLALGIGLLVAWRALYGPVGTDTDSLIPALAHLAGGTYLLQHGISFSVAAGSSALFLVGCSQLYLGALSLVPLPPLDGGRLLMALAPRTHGWEQARYQLVERNIGLAALLVLLLIPLGDGRPMLPRLLDIVLQPVLSGICGG